MLAGACKGVDVHSVSSATQTNDLTLECKIRVQDLHVTSWSTCYGETSESSAVDDGP